LAKLGDEFHNFSAKGPRKDTWGPSKVEKKNKEKRGEKIDYKGTTRLGWGNFAAEL